MTPNGEPIELVELAPRSPRTVQTRDDRRHMPEPPPVRLVAVDDVRLPLAPGNVRKKLDLLFARLLQFAPEHDSGERLTYRAENFRLRFDLPRIEDRSDYRAAVIEVRSLTDLELKLVDAEIEYERVKGLTPGEESFLLRDAAGNLLSIVERREVR